MDVGAGAVLRLLPGATALALALGSCAWPVEPAQAPATTVSCAVPARLRGVDLTRLPTREKVVALTFDAGASAAGVDSILATLQRERIRATFFLTGQFVRAYPRRSALIASRHVVGNHTYSHAHLPQLSDAAITSEVRRAQTAITAVTGQDPRRFFRFPYGERTARTIAVVNRLCYAAFRRSVDTRGWQGTSGGQSVASVVRAVRLGTSPGAIVLMHVGANPQDRSTLDAAALPAVIRYLRSAGYRMVPLTNLMSEPP